jgi:hypothetical protein
MSGAGIIGFVLADNYNPSDDFNLDILIKTINFRFTEIVIGRYLFNK